MINNNMGIYIHIPFCKRKCDYCDFYSVEERELIKPYVSALKKEIEKTSNSIKYCKIDTIYFGGGTPSILEPSIFTELIEILEQRFKFTSCTEITLECNPCTVTKDRAKDWKKTGINRISLGAQSFKDSELKFLRRLHLAYNIFESLDCLRSEGFKNINMDIIFGIPGQTINDFKMNLRRAVELNVQHLSVYGLTIEKNTLLYRRLKNKEFRKINDETYEAMFLTAHSLLERNGYIHYEISNYAKPSFKSKHNLSLWQGKDYLGFGASAHSRLFDTRWANVADVKAYIKDPFAKSFTNKLTEKELELEKIMLGLRTRYGIRIKESSTSESIEFLKEKQLLEQIGNRIFLTANGMLLLDEIIPLLEGKSA